MPWGDGNGAPGEVDALVREVESTLRAIRNPFTGASLVSAVHRREDLYEGPYVSRAPDLVLELALDAGGPVLLSEDEIADALRQFKGYGQQTG